MAPYGAGLQIEGVYGVFYTFKMPKTHWRLCRGLKICFYPKKLPP
jgi:hypothetical protein